MKRIIRNRKLTPEEASKYDLIREQVAKELPELIERHYNRMTDEQIEKLLNEKMGFHCDSPNKILADNDARIDITDGDDYYGMGWKHGGIGDLCMREWGLAAAKVTGALFIHLWLKGVEVLIAHEMAKSYAAHLLKISRVYNR